MALIPTDYRHGLQIQAGILGRNTGHSFEVSLASQINCLPGPIYKDPLPCNIVTGSLEIPLVRKALSILNWDSCDRVQALALGTLATAEEGKRWLEVNGVVVRACKSDILITLFRTDQMATIGVSVKQCNHKTPTNAQLYFTTARAFCNLLINNGIPVSENAIISLRQFCGDEGFRPLDDANCLKNRVSDPRRYFWEEINQGGRLELENIFTRKQDIITKLLFQKAYLNDPFAPEILIHKTKLTVGPSEFALYGIDELVRLSKQYSGFAKKKYSVKKGQHKDPSGTEHDAPRFGIVQMQRGGQKQHPTQLQFNLQAGYFYNI